MANRQARRHGGTSAMSPYGKYKLQQDIQQNVKKEIMAEFGDDSALKLARAEGYEEGFAKGARYTEEHYLRLMYICMGLALNEMHGFGYKRIFKVWGRLNEYYAEIEPRIDDNTDLADIENEYNQLLSDKVGMKLEFDDDGTGDKNE